MSTAIIPAAGMGQRLGAPVPKALVTVGGHSLLEWTLLALEASRVVDQIVIVAPPGQVSAFESLRGDFSQGIRVCEGGRSRQESVRNALLVAQEPGLVLVHDAARCFAPPTLIRRVASYVDADHPAVVPGLPVADTIKVVGAGSPGLVVDTPARATLRAVQTPQGFVGTVLWAAHQQFSERGADEATAATDDAQLVEWSGAPSFVCEGDVAAAKITTKQDLVMATELLAGTLEWTT